MCYPIGVGGFVDRKTWEKILKLRYSWFDSCLHIGGNDGEGRPPTPTYADHRSYGPPHKHARNPYMNRYSSSTSTSTTLSQMIPSLPQPTAKRKASEDSNPLINAAKRAKKDQVGIFTLCVMCRGHERMCVSVANRGKPHQINGNVCVSSPKNASFLTHYISRILSVEWGRTTRRATHCPRPKSPLTALIRTG